VKHAAAAATAVVVSKIKGESAQSVFSGKDNNCAYIKYIFFQSTKLK
jgi:hypothetical protein